LVSSRHFVSDTVGCSKNALKSLLSLYGPAVTGKGREWRDAMKRFTACLGALTGCVLLSACITDVGPTLPSVTRFHLGQPIAHAVIAVESSDPADASSLEFDAVADAVGRELTRLGWTVQKGNARSEQVAIVSVTQSDRIAPRRSGLSIGLGGGTGSYGRHGGVGVGGAVDIPVGRP